VRALIRAVLLGSLGGVALSVPAQGLEPSPAASAAADSLQPSGVKLSGRMSLRMTRLRDGVSDGGTVSFELSGTEHRGRLSLQSAVGTLVANAQWDARGAQVTTPQGTTAAANLDEVSRQLLGAQALPLAALMSWLQGQPWPGAEVRLVSGGFEQLGWHVRLTSWHESVVTAHRPPPPDNPGGVEVMVRALVDRPTDAPRTP